MTRCRDSFIFVAKARAPLFVALALPHGQQAVDHTAENLGKPCWSWIGYHGPLRVKDKQTAINHDKTCEIQSRYGPSTFFLPFGAFSRIDCGSANQDSEKSQKFCASVDSGLMAAAQTFRSITNLSVMFLAISLLLSVDFYVDISWLISLDLWEGWGTRWKPTRFQRQQKTKPADHLPRKNYRNYNKISEKFPFGNWGKLIEILRKPQNQKIKTHLNKRLKVEETTNRHHQSVRFLPHGHRPSRWSVSFNRLTACVGDPVMGKADSGDENAPIRKGW